MLYFNEAMLTMKLLSAPPIQLCSKCSIDFCFSCGNEPHQPARCIDFASWRAIFGSSQYWVKKNAKPCPRCSVPIEKNNGCNHMRCSQCGHDFCWLCLTALGSHLEPHICNRYEPHQSAANEDERRALFFTDRFKAHADAEQFAKREVLAFEEKREKLANEILWFASDEDLDNLYTAATSLVRARNFLKNSYVAAWAMRNDLEHRDVFESHQANLELFTEKLSQLLLLTKVHQLYIEQGARAIHMHFRAIAFSTGSILKYMDRVLDFMNPG
jgi:ariadne-1